MSDEPKHVSEEELQEAAARFHKHHCMRGMGDINECDWDDHSWEDILDGKGFPSEKHRYREFARMLAERNIDFTDALKVMLLMDGRNAALKQIEGV